MPQPGAVLGRCVESDRPVFGGPQGQVCAPGCQGYGEDGDEPCGYRSVDLRRHGCGLFYDVDALRHLLYAIIDVHTPWSRLKSPCPGSPGFWPPGPFFVGSGAACGPPLVHCLYM